MDERQEHPIATAASPAVPPAGERVHLPGGTIQPLLFAVGLAFAIVGITDGIELVVIGCVLMVVVAVRWIRDSIREYNELPLEHDSH